ncbi:MAG TPA: hypothetical protein VFZ65_05365 [Planctomycetota bacterium]|nr:hypothetical protein [Planctomycetota bacterium]
MPPVPAATAFVGSEESDVTTPQGPPAGRRPTWRNGGALLSGYFGATVYDNIEAKRGPVTVTSDDVTIPSLGGGAQLKLGGDGIDLGLEAFLGFNWRASSTAIAVGGGGAAVAVDTDLFLFDLYGGPFASAFLGSGARVYVSAGPLMQWATYDERGNGDGSGFGLGYYARTGLEFVVGRGSFVGLGVRWSQAEIDVDNNLGDLQVDGLMVMLTFSHF